VRLLEPVRRRPKPSKARADGWEGVDEGLFEHLRQLRRSLAEERAVPAYVIFGDATLRAFARLQPRTLSELAAVHGVGEKKLADLGPRFIEAIRAYCD
jgi:ATP-dependent DNA helicase RecQ